MKAPDNYTGGPVSDYQLNKPPPTIMTLEKKIKKYLKYALILGGTAKAGVYTNKKVGFVPALGVSAIVLLSLWMLVMSDFKVVRNWIGLKKEPKRAV